MQTNQEDLYKVHSETLPNNVNVSASLCAPGAIIKGKIIDPEVCAVRMPDRRCKVDGDTVETAYFGNPTRDATTGEITGFTVKFSINKK